MSTNNDTEGETDAEKIKRLEAQVVQYKNIITKLTGQEKVKPGKSHKKGRVFEHELYCKRHVALHICYFGWNYHGFAVQETTGKTIESELFNALLLTKLIQSRETSNYHRCGRTDKGVSAFQQVITIDLRSNLLEGPGVYSYEGCRAHERKRGDEDNEINYCKILNANLPPYVQVLAWAPCKELDYSARFDCSARTYKYFFPRGDLDLDLLKEAGGHLIGEHDYRNFCKMDVGNGVVNYHRRIMEVSVERIDATDSPYDMCALVIKGKAFLWHQIRCIVAILFRVASKKESPEIVKQLLDIEENPRRPQYLMASEIPLNLSYCEYKPELSWHHDSEAIMVTLKQLQDLWTESSVKATMLRSALNAIEDKASSLISSTTSMQVDNLYGMSKIKAGNYVQLLDMDKCLSLEEKLNAMPDRKKRKVIE